MIFKAEQSDLIEHIDEAEGIAWGDYVSASGIPGNLKIELSEAMERNVELIEKMSRFMVFKLAAHKLDIVIATGGAVELGRKVSKDIVGCEFVEIDSRKDADGRKRFYLDESVALELQGCRLGVVEDVSTTWGTVSRVVEDTLLPTPKVAITGWRRGREASALTHDNDEIRAWNIINNTLPVMEERTDYPKLEVIKRPVPLHIEDKRDATELWIPEMSRVR